MSTPTVTPSTTQTPPTTTKTNAPFASLYVGDLLPEVSEGNLFEIFSRVGQVSSIRVCRDTHTRRSLGYAYINFVSVADAERALDTLNNTLINGKACRIMWSQRDPTMRKTGLGNVFIKNLDPKITHKELYDTFSQFGNILSCKVAVNENGESKGYGFVHFEFQKSADAASAAVNDMLLATQKVYVGPFLPKKIRDEKLEGSWTNVFVKDIDPEVTNEEFEKTFEAYGKITSPLIVRKQGQSSYFGFVNYEKHEDAVRAVAELNGFKLRNKEIFCCRAQKRRERSMKLKREWEQLKLTKYQGVNLYVKYLEESIDDERLRKEFEAFGTVESCKVMVDGGVSKGFGFVCFSHPDEAMRAISELNGRVLPGCKKPLYVGLHETKETRRNKLAAQRLHAPKVAARGQGIGGFPGAQPVFYSHPYANVMPGAPRGGWGPQGMHGQYPPPQMISGHMQPIVHQQARQQGNRGKQQQGGTRGNGAHPHQRKGQIEAELSAQVLSQYPFEQQKIVLGEKLYPMIGLSQPELAGKITGMFLDSGWSIEELLSLVHDKAKLEQRIADAVLVLRDAFPPQTE